VTVLFGSAQSGMSSAELSKRFGVDEAVVVNCLAAARQSRDVNKAQDGKG
jgi:transposase